MPAHFNITRRINLLIGQNLNTMFWRMISIHWPGILMFTIYCGYGMLWIIIAFHSHMPWPLGHRGSPVKNSTLAGLSCYGDGHSTPPSHHGDSRCFQVVWCSGNCFRTLTICCWSQISDLPDSMLPNQESFVACRLVVFRLNEKSVDPEPNETVKKPTPTPRSSEAVNHAMPRQRDMIGFLGFN